MAHRFAVSFSCGLNKLNTIIDVLDGEIDRLVVMQEEDGTDIPAHRAAEPRPVDPPEVRVDKSKTAAIVYEHMMQGAVYSSDDFAEVLAANGYRPGSASPSLSLLLLSGKIEKVGKGRYRRPEGVPL